MISGTPNQAAEGPLGCGSPCLESKGTHSSSLSLAPLLSFSSRVYSTSRKHSSHNQFSNINFSCIFCSSNNSAQQNTQNRQHLMWFMNKTTKPDSPVDRYGMTYELQIYRLFCCMMPRLCDSRWLCTPPTWASILYLKSLVFASPRNHETSELKMGPRRTIAHCLQTASPPAETV